jgi:UDP-N-acetylglucosamine/UDP-N-acetylgalactosamine diphosphorylase
VVVYSENVLARSGCVILAGGQGSRLGVTGPKGLFPILGKPLFQHIVEKVPVCMPIAIMTSPLNHADTVEFFARNGFFGRQISFFQQEMVDLLDENYLAVGEGPNGNGSFYRSIVTSGVLEQFENNGIDTLLIMPVDNPLVDPADEKLVTFHLQTEADVTIKCIERKKNESMGALSVRQGKLSIVEYFAIEEDKFFFSYTGQLALSTRFIRKASSIHLPYHWVRKKFIWKREKLLFDVFSAAESIKALCYAREVCYAPIKRLENQEEVEGLLALLQKNSGNI